jgi:uncharacterized membrane protein YcaP (DUF421 family)
VVVRDGQIDMRALQDLGLSRADVVIAVRRQGANTLAEVAQAELEPDGKILVRLNAADEGATKGDVARVEAKLDTLLGRLGPTAT